MSIYEELVTKKYHITKATSPIFNSLMQIERLNPDAKAELDKLNSDLLDELIPMPRPELWPQVEMPVGSWTQDDMDKVQTEFDYDDCDDDNCGLHGAPKGDL